MDEILNLTKNYSDSDSRKLIFIHEKILSIGSISYRVFPIYIRYTKGSKIIAILYFNKKKFLDLGLNLRKKPQNSEFKDASYMKYPGIKYSIVIKDVNDLTEEIIDQL